MFYVSAITYPDTSLLRFNYNYEFHFLHSCACITLTFFFSEGDFANFMTSRIAYSFDDSGEWLTPNLSNISQLQPTITPKYWLLSLNEISSTYSCLWKVTYIHTSTYVLDDMFTLLYMPNCNLLPLTWNTSI